MPMFTEYETIQPIVNQFKVLLLQNPADERRSDALEALKHFEQQPWHPAVLSDVLNQTPGLFQREEGCFVAYMPTLDDFDMIDAICHVCKEYTLRVNATREDLAERRDAPETQTS